MNTWVLVIVFGISWAGPGGIQRAEYPNEAACYRALAAMRTDSPTPVESEKKRSMIAYCKPRLEGEKS